MREVRESTWIVNQSGTRECFICDNCRAEEFGPVWGIAINSFPNENLRDNLKGWLSLRYFLPISEEFSGSVIAEDRLDFCGNMCAIVFLSKKLGLIQ